VHALTLAIVIAATALSSPISIAQARECGAESSWTSCPSATNSGSSIDLSASRTKPGGSTGHSSPGGNGNGGSSQPSQPDVGATPEEPEECILNRCDIHYEVVLLRDVTLTDVASFAPAPLPLTDEPDGVGIVGMPVNFVIDADTTTEHGTLFDLPVAVRFTPASFTISPGDGSSYRTTTGGARWGALGSAQFTATPTSHAYAARGTYTATATVHYAAAVDFGNGWIPVPGTLDITTSATTLRIVEVHTALVDRTCTEDPTGPGC